MKKSNWQATQWSCFLALGLTFHGSVADLFARPKASTPQEAIPAIAIRVHNYAAVSEWTLARAQAEAGRILLEAGVELRWFDCTLNPADLERYSACVQHGGLGVIDINLITRSVTTLAKHSDTTLGLTPMTKDGERVALAMIFFNLVEAHVTALGVSVDHLLGHAVAHEIGHMLLRTHGHSNQGIMRAEWSPIDLQLAARGGLNFTSQQAEIIRAEVSTRNRIQAGVLSGIAERK